MQGRIPTLVSAKSPEPQGHTAQVLCMDALFNVSWTEDHCQTLTGSADFTARIWNLRSGKVRAVLEGHTGWVRTACLAPDAEVAVTGSNDCTVRVWQVLIMPPSIPNTCCCN